MNTERKVGWLLVLVISSAACRSTTPEGSLPESVFKEYRPGKPETASKESTASGRKIIRVYKISKEDLEQCLNWTPALAQASKWAACDLEGKGDKSSACQKKLADCNACDICAILQPGLGPNAFVRNLGRGMKGCTEAPWGLTCPGWGNWSSEWEVLFHSSLCQDPGRVNELAKTMIHEASHACPSVGGGKVEDLGSDGCTAYDIAETCTQ